MSCRHTAWNNIQRHFSEFTWWTTTNYAYGDCMDCPLKHVLLWSHKNPVSETHWQRMPKCGHGNTSAPNLQEVQYHELTHPMPDLAPAAMFLSFASYKPPTRYAETTVVCNYCQQKIPVRSDYDEKWIRQEKQVVFRGWKQV
jgi:hypothetical protein